MTHDNKNDWSCTTCNRKPMKTITPIQPATYSLSGVSKDGLKRRTRYVSTNKGSTPSVKINTYPLVKPVEMQMTISPTCNIAPEIRIVPHTGSPTTADIALNPTTYNKSDESCHRINCDQEVSETEKSVQETIAINVSTRNSFAALSDAIDSSTEISEQEREPTLDYVTKRNAKKKKQLSLDETHINNDILCQSLPNIQINSEEINELREEIDKLKSALLSAEEEIDNLSLENVNLRRRLTKSEKIILNYKSVGIGNLHPSSYFSPKYRHIRPSTTTSSPNKNMPNHAIYNNQTSFHEYSFEEGHRDLVTSSPKTYAKITATSAKIPARTAQHHSVIPETLVQHRVIIYADENGRNLRSKLQDLLGEQFSVHSVLKPYSSMDHILETCKSDCHRFSKKDFVVILGGTNDKCLKQFHSSLRMICKFLKNTNVLIGDVVYNRDCNIDMLNDIVKTVSSKNIYTSQFEVFPYLKNITRVHKVETCRAIWRAIMHVKCNIEHAHYYSTKRSSDTNPTKKSSPNYAQEFFRN